MARLETRSAEAGTHLAQAPAWLAGPVPHVTWLGHATVLIDDGARILTDPVLTASLGHLRRRQGEVPGSLAGRVDAVLISHLHLDHLHIPSLRLIDPGTPVLLPRGAAGLVRGLPLEPVEVAVGDEIPIGDTSITVVKALHSGDRWPWGGPHGEAVGFVVKGRATTYFAGDTEPFPEMAGIAGGPLDLALLPVWGWGPNLRGGHLDPVEAAGCLPVLRPRVAVPVHYGTLWPRGLGWVRPRVFHEPGNEFAALARGTAPEVDVRVLRPGDSTTVTEH